MARNNNLAKGYNYRLRIWQTGYKKTTINFVTFEDASEHWLTNFANKQLEGDWNAYLDTRADKGFTSESLCDVVEAPQTAVEPETPTHTNQTLKAVLGGLKWLVSYVFYVSLNIVMGILKALWWIVRNPNHDPYAAS